MGLLNFFSKKDDMNGPIFKNERPEIDEDITKLEQLQKNISDVELNREIEDRKRNIKKGNSGENEVKKALRRTDIDMFVLEDIFLQHNGDDAQIDFIAITRKTIYIIECKNNNRNIEIDNAGLFYYYDVNGIRRRMDKSPFQQNKEHMAIIKRLVKEHRGIINTERLKPLIVYAFKNNTSGGKKSLNKKMAPGEVAQQVILVEELIPYIEHLDQNVSSKVMSKKEMETIADFFMKMNIPYTERDKYLEKFIADIRKMANIKAMSIKETETKFFKIVEDSYYKRLQLIFPGVPNEEARNILKNNGFQWNPEAKAWQRELDNNGKYALTKVLQEMEKLEKEHTKYIETETKHCKVIENNENMRLQLVFDGKPESAVRDVLKSNGFKWAPSQSAWEIPLNNDSRKVLILTFRQLDELEAKKVNMLKQLEKEVLIEKLKKFRMEKSIEEGIKPYYIFNDLQMQELLEKHPRTKEELLKINGFAEYKVGKYGDQILQILSSGLHR